MKRILVGTVILLILDGCAFSDTHRNVLIEPTKRLSTETKGQLELRIPVGEVFIKGADDGDLEGTLEFYCESKEGRCAKKAAKAKFVTTVTDNRTIVSFEPSRSLSYRKTNAKFSFRVPPVDSLSVIMGPGDIVIENIRGCLDVDMDAGDIDVKSPLKDVAKVHLDANFGDASLTLPDGTHDGKRKLLVGAEVNWNKGVGLCNLEVQLQAGDVSVQLTD